MFRERWHFETDCIHSDGPSINALLESATDISYATAYKILGPALTQRAAELGYGGRGNLKLKDDWHVSWPRLGLLGKSARWLTTGKTRPVGLYRTLDGRRRG